MKKLIIKCVMIMGITLSITSCKKSELEHVDVPGVGFTTIEMSKDLTALSSTGTTASSVVTVNYIVGEKIFPSKIIPKLTVYYLVGSTTSSTRTQLYTATNVSLTPTPSPAAGAPVVTAIGSYGNGTNIVWGLKYTFNLGAIGTGLTSTSNGVTTNTRGTSLIIVARDSSDNILAEYSVAISEYGLRTI